MGPWCAQCGSGTLALSVKRFNKIVDLILLTLSS